jgi:hypothetical protein
MVWSPDYLGSPGKVVLSNPLTCTNTPKGENKLYSDAKGVVPSLDLRFAEGKNLNDYMTGQNLITFSRSSIGTYVDENGIIQTATADTPRFDHDPTTGESLGLLIEESRTNLLIRSQEFDNSYWTLFPVGDTTVSPDAVTSPDGTLTADKLVEGTSTGRHYIEKLLYPGASTTYTFSVYVKAAGRTQVVIYPNAQTGFTKYVTFNLSTGVVVVENGTNITGNIQRLSNEWFRVSITTVSGVNSQYSPIIGLTNNTGPTYTESAASYTGDGTSGIYIWGAQLEAGSFPTSYIPTTGTALTRNADVASITGANFNSWYNQSEGSIYAESNAYNLSSLSALFSANDGSFSNRITSTPLTYGLFIATNNAIQVSINAGGAWNPGQVVKAGFGIAVNDFSVVLDGSTLNTDNSGSIPVVDRLNIGRNAGNTSPWNGTIARLTYFPDRLEDSVLQAITQ